jgi:hypothetical protein
MWEIDRLGPSAKFIIPATPDGDDEITEPTLHIHVAWKTKGVRKCA